MLWIAVAVMATLSVAHAQETAQANVAPELRECYTDPLLQDRNNLPPATIQVLIDIIQKIEDNPDVNVDLRVLSVLLQHLYRQDGIEYHAPQDGVASTSVVLPFAPTFHSFHRYRLLLTRMLPRNQQTMPYNTISSSLKCALHNMLSSTVDLRIRGDENNCGQLSQLRALRTSRDTYHMEKTEDVEIFSPRLQESEYGQLTQLEPTDDVEFTNNDGLVRFERQSQEGSTCPILTGVIKTRWGAVSAGNLIAGIAAGAQLEEVPISDLTKGTVPAVTNVQQNVLNLYPATLTGDLAEAVLLQGSRARTSISIGNAGNWNSTQAPRYFMLSTRQNVEMTDPEIRGGLDGFILGRRMNNINQIYGGLRLSQLLDMYYSPRNGVYDSGVRACNRRTQSETVIDNNLVTQTESFAVALNANMPLPGTITNGINELVVSAVNNLRTYTQSNMNDLSCDVTESINDTRMKTNLYIVLDTSFPYQTVYPAISYLLDSIEVGKYGSSVTLLSAFDGSVVINQTFHLSDFHAEYTIRKHQSMTTGVNLETAFTNIKNMMHSQLQNETRMNYVGGNSTVLLFLLNSGTIENNQKVYEQARIMNDTVPDLRILFATSNNQVDNLWNLVRDMYGDIHTITLSSNGADVERNLGTVLNSIQRVSRRIINPLCGFEFNNGEDSGTRQFDDVVEPGSINFYAVSSNYFFDNSENTLIRISRTTVGSGSLSVCFSRTVQLPRRNSSIVGVGDNLVTCEDITSSGNVEIRLQGACDGYSSIGTCPPMYISVQAVTTANTFTAVCTDTRLCRFPYDNRFVVQAQNLRCRSSGANIASSLIFIVSALLMHLLRLQ